MEITKEALQLFIQSLPVDSKFAIISFGSRSNFLQNKNKKTALPAIGYKGLTYEEALNNLRA